MVIALARSRVRRADSSFRSSAERWISINAQQVAQPIGRDALAAAADDRAPDAAEDAGPIDPAQL